MTPGGRRAGCALVALALAAGTVSGCGKKGPVVAPERRLPLPISDLRAHIDEEAVVVEWTNPKTRVDGSSLKDLRTVKLYRHEEIDGAPIKPAMLSRGGIAGYEEIASVRLDAPAPAVVRGDAVEWIDRRALVPGRRYVYVVTAADTRGRTSAPSQRLPVPFLVAPRPPADLRAAPGDHQVTLTWEAPTELADGAPVSGPLAYVVLRGAGPEGPLSPINPADVTDTSYIDKGLDNDSEYRYAVRAVQRDPRVSAAGVPSATVTAVPIDITPPSPPKNLVAVPSPGAVRLAWAPNPEEDVALYAIYRAAGAGGFLRVGSAVGGVTTFIDRDVGAGATYRYAVTALDRARTPNESGRSAEITVTVP